MAEGGHQSLKFSRLRKRASEFEVFMGGEKRGIRALGFHGGEKGHQSCKLSAWRKGVQSSKLSGWRKGASDFDFFNSGWSIAIDGDCGWGLLSQASAYYCDVLMHHIYRNGLKGTMEGFKEVLGAITAKHTTQRFHITTNL